MADCEMLTRCPFFSDTMAQKPASAELFKQSFCRGDKESCARYQLIVSGQDVPINMFPNNHERANKILALRNNGIKISYKSTQ